MRARKEKSIYFLYSVTSNSLFMMKRSKKIRIENQRKALDDYTLLKIPLGDIRKYSIDSVHEDAFSVEISELVLDKTFKWNELDLARFEFWKPLEVNENDNWTKELSFEIPYDEVHEGMVFIFDGENVVEITDLVREESKKLYSQMLAREHDVRRRRSQL